MRRSSVLASAALALALSGCTSVVPEGPFVPTLQPVTQTNLALRDLPPPRERIVVAVYENDDLTGQYKERDAIHSLSTAVTQGGAPMLIQALQEAGERSWFTVLERAELDNLLKERQIQTETRRIYRDEQRVDPHALPPLLHANIIIEGAIVGYDTNTITGGAGARFLGIGGDAKYQHDTVTVTLRAVSTRTGEVLTSVTTAKSIYSVAVQGGVFRFVKLDELFEGEAGITTNEPRYIAVQQATEWAVTSLILEGAELGVWHFDDAAEQDRLVALYNEDKYGERAPEEAATPPVQVATLDPTAVTQTKPRAPRQTNRQLAARQPVQQQAQRQQPRVQQVAARPQAVEAGTQVVNGQRVPVPPAQVGTGGPFVPNGNRQAVQPDAAGQGTPGNGTVPAQPDAAASNAGEAAKPTPPPYTEGEPPLG